MKPHALCALLLTVTATACGATDDPVVVDAETFTFDSYDAKSDSVETHQLVLEFAGEHVLEPETWTADSVEYSELLTTVVYVDETHIQMRAQQLIFRPVDSTEHEGVGWHAAINDWAESQIGTAFGMAVWYRPRHTQRAWIPLTMPRDGEFGKYYQSIASEPGEAPEHAKISEIPQDRCAKVLGHSAGDDTAPWDATHHYPQLDDEAEMELRIVTLPVFNYCDWNEGDGFAPEITISPLNGKLGRRD